METAIWIEELERKFDENPRRYFAPLADEYRRSGRPDRAVELCLSEVARQPTHLSAHVILARALLALGRDADARDALRTALEVDAGNVVALGLMAEVASHVVTAADEPRSLAEIAIDAAEPVADELQPAEQSVPSGEPAAVGAPEAAGAPAVPSVRAPLVTETVAELYLEQGHRGAAIEVLRQILERRPGDADVRARLASLEAPAQTGETVRAMFARLAARGARALGSTPRP